MKLNGIKLAVFDVDGTILADDHRLPDDALQGLQKLIERGIVVSLATGRTLEMVREIAVKIDPVMPLILLNGAWIHDLQNKENWLALNLDLSIARKIVGLLKEWDYEVIVQKAVPDAHYFYYDSFNEDNRERCSQIERNSFRCRRVDDIYEVLHEDPGEITVLDTDKRIRRCIELLEKEKLNCKLTYSTSPFIVGFSWLEILNPLANKGYALDILAKKLGVERAQVLAAGDNYNDIEMIKWAGVGVAVGNAVPALKEAADIILQRNHNGLCELFEMLE